MNDIAETTRALSIRASRKRWVVRASGAVLGETRGAKIMDDDGGEAVVFFPRRDIADALLEPNGGLVALAHKGKAQFYDIVMLNRTLEKAAWSLQEATKDLASVEDYIAFEEGDFLVVEAL